MQDSHMKTNAILYITNMHNKDHSCWLPFQKEKKQTISTLASCYSVCWFSRHEKMYFTSFKMENKSFKVCDYVNMLVSDTWYTI